MRKIADCLIDIAEKLSCPCCECNKEDELKNIATEFNQIVVTDQNDIIALLKEALADEICAFYQYWGARHMSRGKGKADTDPQFEQHSYEELEHANKLIERIKQLGQFPYENLKQITETCKSNAALGCVSHNVCELLKVTIQAQKDAIECYKNIIKASVNTDPTTHKLAKSILEDQEQHLYDLEILLEQICQ